MTTYLGKSCSFGLPRVPFVNCRQFMYLVISLLVLGAGCGIWLYQFLIIAYLFTYNRTKLCGNQSGKGYLFEGVTNIKHARLSHYSLIKERCDLSANASGTCDDTRYNCSCNLLCGMSLTSFGVMQRQNPPDFMTYGRKFNLRGLEMSSGMCEPVRIKHVCSPLSAFRQLFCYLDSEQHRQTVHIMDTT